MLLDAEVGSVGAGWVCGGADVAGCGKAVPVGVVVCTGSVEGGDGCGGGSDGLVECGACGWGNWVGGVWAWDCIGCVVGSGGGCGWWVLSKGTVGCTG